MRGRLANPLKGSFRNPATSNGGGLAAVAACVLLFVNGVTAQDEIDDSQEFADSAASYLAVEISDDTVTLKAENVGVGDVLDEIAYASDLVVVPEGPLYGRLTLEFERLPLDEALRRIMRGRSYLLHQARPARGASNANHAHRNTLWIFSDGAADESGVTRATGRSAPTTAVVIEALESQLRSDDARLREAAIKGLRRLKVNEVIAPLSYALSDEDKNNRVKAIYALAEIGGDNAVAAMAAAAADENPWVRAETAYALGTLGGGTAIQVLKHALHDEDSDVRESAIEAFTDIGGSQAAAALATALQDGDASLRAEAVDALADIGGETATRILYQALESQDNAVRQAANEALAELASEDQ